MGLIAKKLRQEDQHKSVGYIIKILNDFTLTQFFIF